MAMVLTDDKHYINNEGVNSVTFSTKTKEYLDEVGAVFNGMTWKEYILSKGWTY